MKLVTWNVNSIRQRLPRLLALLDRHDPDVVLIQETKVEDATFPTMEIVAAGYECALLGQRSYNGVGILTRVGLADVTLGFEGDPVPEQSRVISATVDDDLRVVCVYVVNGTALTDVSWLLREFLLPLQALVPLGMKLSGDIAKVWFLALYLPDAWQWPMIAFMFALGVLAFSLAARTYVTEQRSLRRRRAPKV